MEIFFDKFSDSQQTFYHPSKISLYFNSIYGSLVHNRCSQLIIVFKGRRIEKLIHLLTIHLSFYLNPNLVFIYSLSHTHTLWCPTIQPPTPPLKNKLYFSSFLLLNAFESEGGKRIENFDDKEPRLRYQCVFIPFESRSKWSLRERETKERKMIACS